MNVTIEKLFIYPKLHDFRKELEFEGELTLRT